MLDDDNVDLPDEDLLVVCRLCDVDVDLFREVCLMTLNDLKVALRYSVFVFFGMLITPPLFLTLLLESNLVVVLFGFNSKFFVCSDS